MDSMPLFIHTHKLTVDTWLQSPLLNCQWPEESPNPMSISDSFSFTIPEQHLCFAKHSLLLASMGHEPSFPSPLLCFSFPNSLLSLKYCCISFCSEYPLLLSHCLLMDDFIHCLVSISTYIRYQISLRVDISLLNLSHWKSPMNRVHSSCTK